MSAQLKAAQRQQDNDCDCCPPCADPVELSALRLAEIDVRVSEELDGDTCTDLFVVLADASDCNLVSRLAQGYPMGSMSARQLDVFARLARLADAMADERAIAIAHERLAGGAL